MIDPQEISSKDRVVFGLKITIEDIENGDTQKYQLVGPDESDPEKGLISITSPIGRALIGRRVDEDVQVRTPGGIREFIILDIE